MIALSRACSVTDKALWKELWGVAILRAEAAEEYSRQLEEENQRLLTLLDDYAKVDAEQKN